MERPGPVLNLRGLLEANAEHRQRVLNEVLRAALVDFVGRTITPYLLEQATLCVRNALDEAIQAGTYVLPDELTLSHIELGGDMRLKVFFRPAANRFDAVAAEINNTPEEEEPE